MAGFLAIGCGNAAPPSAQSAPVTPPRAPAAPPVNVVFQPWRVGGARLLALPERKVLWSEENYLTFYDKQSPGEAVDPGRFVAVASLPISSLMPRSIVLTPNGADAIALFSVTATAWDGRLIGTEMVRVVERWNLATRTRLWSRTLPAMPNVQDGPGSKENDDLLTLGPGGLFATRCMGMIRPSPTTNCHVVALDEHTGALGPAEAWTSTDFSFSWWNHDSQQVSAGRRYTLVNGYQYWNRFPHFLVFDDRGRIVGRVKASCARFAEGGSEEMPSILIDERSDLNENAAISRRFRLVKDASACQLQQYAAEASKYQRTDDKNRLVSQYDWIGGGRRIVWSSLTQRFLTWDKLPRAYSMDIDRVGLPAPLPAPPGAEDDRVLFAGSGSDLYAYTKKSIFHLEEAGFALDSVNPGHGVLLSQGDDALMATYAGLDDSQYVLWSGKRRPGKGGFTWQKISAVSQFTPDFESFEGAGRPQMLIAGGKAGLQWVDMRTGQVILRSCSQGAQSPNRCGDPNAPNDYRGLVVSSARQTAFAAHNVTDPSGRLHDSFDELELSTGKLLRSFPAPGWAVSSPLDLPMGWVEKDRRFWIEGAESRLGASASVTIVTIPAKDGAAPRYESFSAQSQVRNFGADPEGRFFVFGRELDTIDVFAPSGARVITMGVRSDGAFAQTGDGRFACTGSACDELRCVVGNVARLVTDPACAAFRAEGFSIIEELARAQRGREADKTSRRE